jgi:ABC-2 type transport system permease protein
VIPGMERRRILSIAAKELRHIRRDPFTLGMGLGLPLLLVAFFGWVMNLDVREVKVAVADRDNTRASRALAEAFYSSGFFSVSRAPEGGALTRITDAGRAKAVVVIEPGFSRRLSKGESGRVQVLLDGADNTTAGMVLGYLAGVERSANAHVAGIERRPPVSLETRFLFNPELNSRWFIVPGLMAVVMGMLSVMLTALTVAREWETGSMELLLSKLLPYMGLSLAAVTLVYLMARLALGVPFAGSHALFLLACLLFLVPSLAQGILISVLTRQQALATQIGLVTGLLPPLLLSGFVFPIESMPLFFRYFTGLLAPRWFVEVCRGIFLKGAGPVELAGPLLAMIAIGFVLTAVAMRKFKADLEP